VAKTRKGVPNAQSREETRQALVDAALQLLQESGPGLTLDSLKIRDICKRADGRTTGAFYGIWSGMADFTRDLVVRIAEHEARSPGAGPILGDLKNVRSVVRRGFARGDDVTEVLRDAAAEDLAQLCRNPVWPTQVEAVLRHRGNPEVSAACRQAFLAADELTGDVYSELLSKGGLTLRAPFTSRDLGVVLQALVEGFALRSIVDPEHSQSVEVMSYPSAVSLVTSALCAEIDQHESARKSKALHNFGGRGRQDLRLKPHEEGVLMAALYLDVAGSRHFGRKELLNVGLPAVGGPPIQQNQVQRALDELGDRRWVTKVPETKVGSGGRDAQTDSYRIEDEGRERAWQLIETMRREVPMWALEPERLFGSVVDGRAGKAPTRTVAGVPSRTRTVVAARQRSSEALEEQALASTATTLSGSSLM
jgi:AcrR family transcriptional regulator